MSHSSERIGWTARLVAGGFLILAAVGGLIDVAGGSATLLTVFAAIGVVGAALALGFDVLQKRARDRAAQDAMLRRSPTRVHDLAQHDGFYGLGVANESPAALSELGLSGVTHAPYLKRDVDEQLRSRLRDAASRAEPTLVVVSGPSAAGKSRTLAEALVATLPDAWLLAPSREEPHQAFAALAAGGPPKRIRSTPAACVIWLDDIEWFTGDRGLGPEALDALGAWRRPVVVVGTAGGKGRRAAGAGFADAVSDLLRRHPPVRLRTELSDAERAGVPGDAEVRSIGEFMISADQLIERYEHDSDCPEGVAVTRAAIDWRRTGLLRPIPADVLERLYALYLNGPAGPDRFRSGLEWATKPLYFDIALVQGRGPYEPNDYIVSYEEGSIPEAMWTAVIDEHATAWEMHIVGIAADSFGATEMTERAFRRGYEREDAGAAYNLAVLLRQRGEVEAAEAAERRGRQHAAKAIRRGENKARREHLGRAQRWEQRGELDMAITAYRSAARSDEEDVAAAARTALARLEGRA